MSLSHVRLMRSFFVISFVLMLTSVAFARDYVVPDAPFIIEYEGVDHWGQVNLSSDGRFVVMVSVLDYHVYIHDRQTSMTERVSVDSEGQTLPGSSGTLSVSVSDDGRFVVFDNTDVGQQSHIYLRDRLADETQIISDAQTGSLMMNPFITPDGRFILFWGGSIEGESCENSNGCTSVYVYDRISAKTEMVSVNDAGVPADNANAFAAISDNGRYVLFLSDASNLSEPRRECEEFEEQIIYCAPLYLHDRQQHTTRLIPTTYPEAEPGLIVSATLFGINISGNGRYVVYSYQAEGEGEQPYVTYIYDVLTDTTEIIRLGDTNTVNDFTHHNGLSAISDDGRFLILGKETDNYVYIYDRVTDTATPVENSLGQPFALLGDSYATVPPAISISGDGSTIVMSVNDPGGGALLAHGQTFSPAPYTEVELVQNGGAEAQGVMTKMPQNWNITDYRAGRRRCDHFPNTDTCVFQIKPVKNKIARLTQSVPAVNNPGDTLNFSAFVRGDNVSRATVRVLVNYADGTTEFVKIPSATLNGTYEYKQVTANLTLDKLAYSIKVQMYIHNCGTGKLLVDDVSLMLGSGEPEALDLIPMPEAPTHDSLPVRTTN